MTAFPQVMTADRRVYSSKVMPPPSQYMGPPPSMPPPGHYEMELVPHVYDNTIFYYSIA